MKTSARNHWSGKVTGINEGPVSTEVTLALDTGDSLVATVTTGSARRLGLRDGSRASALVKASSVILAAGPLPATSARNTFEGRVSGVERGAVQGVVTVRSAAGTEVTATVTLASVDSLGLADGSEVSALVKASHVLLAVE